MVRDSRDYNNRIGRRGNKSMTEKCDCDRCLAVEMPFFVDGYGDADEEPDREFGEE